MPSADQAPVKSSHSTMRWHKWVVLIAGSTGSALRAVRPPNLHTRTGNLWHALVVRVVNNMQQFRDSFAPDGRDNAELDEVRSDRINRRGCWRMNRWRVR